MQPRIWLPGPLILTTILACSSARDDAAAPAPVAPSAEAGPDQASPGPDAGGTNDPVGCDARAAAFCAKLDECAPATRLKRQYGDLATCTARQRARCLAQSAVTTHTRTLDDETACARALTASKGCDDFLVGKLPAACAGGLADGAKCNLDEECRGGFCRKDAAACGVCITLPSNEGDRCPYPPVEAPCAPGLHCAASTVTCVNDGDVGAACSFDDECKRTLRCVDKKCTARSTAGGPCKDWDECVEGYTCRGNLEPTSGPPEIGVCVPQTWAKKGEACGHLDLQIVECAGPLTCSAGKCIDTPNDGAACAFGAYDSCAAPAICSEGKCALAADRCR